MLIKELGNQLKQRRDILHITQPDLAELSGVNINTIYKIETGQGNPTLKVLGKLADVLGMELKLEVKKPTL